VTHNKGIGLTVGEDLDDLLHFLFETDFENTVRFINHQRLDILEDESFGVLLSVLELS
jgi:hypothetical protein